MVRLCFADAACLDDIQFENASRYLGNWLREAESMS